MNILSLRVAPGLTRDPVYYQLVGSDLLAHGVYDLGKRHCTIDYAAVGIQGVALMFLLVHMKDLDEAIRCTLGVGTLDTELLDSVFEIRNFAV